jgi:hypothetical protein
MVGDDGNEFVVIISPLFCVVEQFDADGASISPLAIRLTKI